MNRGAATVELALGATVWVTVVLLGLWMSEVSFLSTKVQEASANTIWDATGRKIDDYSVPDNASGNADYANAISQASARATSSYANFDGVLGSGSGTHRLLAHGTGMNARCVPGAGKTPLRFDTPAVTTYDDGSGTVVPGRDNRVLERLYKQRPATLCTANAYVFPWQLPQHFLDDSRGFFKTALRTSGAIQLCGAGRAKNGSCSDGYAVLLGDWAVDGQPRTQITENLPLPLENRSQRGNLPYRRMVEELFTQSGRDYGANTGTFSTGSGASQRFQRRMSNMQGIHNELNFYMSYAGSENDYGDMLSPDVIIPDPTCRTCHFNTSGTQTVNGNPPLPDPNSDWRKLRQPCFLGIGGCPTPP